MENVRSSIESILSDNRTKQRAKFGSIASPSRHVEQSREKLLKAWETIDLQITPESLEKAKASIHKRIADTASDRVPVPGKRSIRLFNHNEDVAEMSKKTTRLAQQLFSKNLQS